MAADNEIKVIIGGDGSDLSKTIRELEADLQGFKSQLKDTTGRDNFADLNKQIDQTVKNIDRLKSVGLPKEIASIRPAAGQAGAALTSLTRVVQDAPFGFIAIQNNIEELPLAFARLSQAAGGTGGAFKAFFGSLLGPAGIGFAISSVTALVTAGIQKYGSLGAAVQALVGNIDETAAAQKRFSDGIREANKEAGSELAKLTLLTSAASDASRSTDERQRAVSLLRQEFKPYFAELSNEAILNGQVALATKKASDAIVERAKATAVQKRLGEVETELLNIDLERATALDNLTDAQNKLNAAFAKQQKYAESIKKTGVGPGPTLDFNYLGSVSGVESAKKKLLELGDAQTKFVNEQNALVARFKTTDLPLPEIKLAKPPREKTGKTLEQLFYDINEQAGKDWAKLQSATDKEADDYFKDIARNLASGDKAQKVIDALNHTNEAVRRGLMQVRPNQPGDENKTPYDSTLSDLERLEQLRGRFRQLGKNAPDYSYLSSIKAQADATAKALTPVEAKAHAIGLLVTDFVAPAFSNFFGSIIDGSQKAGKALVTAFKQIVAQLVSTLATAALLAGIFSLLGIGGTGSTFKSLFKGFLGGNNGLGGLLQGKGYGFAGGGLEFAGGGDSLVARVAGKDLEFVLNRSRSSGGRLGG